MRFTNEDHLTVHQAKHKMSLSLTPGSTRTGIISFVADQTPTPSKFLRNCEEMGLFHELSKNPFEEAFKKASEDKSFQLNERQLDSDCGDTLHRDNALDSLHTPTPNVLECLLRRLVSVPSQHMIGTLSTATLSTTDNAIDVGAGGGDNSDTVTVTMSDQDVHVVSTVDYASSSTASLTATPVILQATDVPECIDVEESVVDNLDVTQQIVVVSDDIAEDDHVQYESVVTPTPIASINVLPESTMDTSDDDISAGNTVIVSSANSSDVPLPVVQVFLKTPDGSLIPVQIPAPTVSQSYHTGSVCVPTMHIAPSSVAVVSTGDQGIASSSSSSSAVRAVATTSRPQPATTSMGITSETKQRLKAAIQQNVQVGVLQSNMRVMSDAVDFVTANTSNSGQTSQISPPRPVTSSFSPKSNSMMIRIPGQQIQFEDADTSTPKRRSRPSSVSEDEDPEEKRRKFLERNRAAAARCRTRKKEMMSKLEVKADHMVSANNALQAEVVKLRQEVAQLKSMLLAHQDCPVTRQQQQQQQQILAAQEQQTAEVQVIGVITAHGDEAITMTTLGAIADYQAARYVTGTAVVDTECTDSVQMAIDLSSGGDEVSITAVDDEQPE